MKSLSLLLGKPLSLLLGVSGIFYLTLVPVYQHTICNLQILAFVTFVETRVSRCQRITGLIYDSDIRTAHVALDRRFHELGTLNTQFYLTNTFPGLQHDFFFAVG